MRLKTDAGKPAPSEPGSPSPAVADNGADIARAQRRQSMESQQGSPEADATASAAQRQVAALIARITADPATALGAHGRIDPA
jgi:hypothetical protein